MAVFALKNQFDCPFEKNEKFKVHSQLDLLQILYIFAHNDIYDEIKNLILRSFRLFFVIH